MTGEIILGDVIQFAENQKLVHFLFSENEAIQ